MASVIWHSVFALSYIFDPNTEIENDDSDLTRLVKIVIDIYLVFVVVLHAPIVILQLYAQIKKICRKTPIPDPNYVDEHMTTNSQSYISRGTQFDKESGYGMIIPSRSYAIWYNLKQIFAYKP